MRQLATKQMTSNSWFIYVQKILHQYDLPNAHHLIEEVPSKQAWKSLVLNKILDFHTKELEKEKDSHTSTRYMSTTSVNLKGSALMWSTAMETFTEVEKAFLKAKIITGTYYLQAVASVHNRLLSPTCRMCNLEPENRLHFVLICPSLEEHRISHINALRNSLTEHDVHQIVERDELTLQLLLDATSEKVPDEIRLNQRLLVSLEHISRNMLYHLHVCRWRILGRVWSMRRKRRIQPKKPTDSAGGPRKVYKTT